MREGGHQTSSRSPRRPSASVLRVLRENPDCGQTLRQRPARCRLLTGHRVRAYIERRHDAVGVCGDVRAEELVEVVAQDERAVLTKADEVRRYVERLLVCTGEHELIVERVLDDVLLAAERHSLETIQSDIEVVLEGPARREVLAQEKVECARARERLVRARVDPLVGERRRFRERRPGRGAPAPMSVPSAKTVIAVARNAQRDSLNMSILLRLRRRRWGPRVLARGNPMPISPIG
jgi:hypothetical protein